ncbi:MAG: guanylate kinase [Desulfobacterales bacterium]|nr:guanylate kinase [Desulfobacterales bacterium]MDD3081114.1 guanylate kinase [Desulfobacterales bacterium]MDD3950195.1 guanylate kinase [Desulfobacterales bacterium]MDD4463554.1 guanylate kinase [Desulfobacterales bacterium]
MPDSPSKNALSRGRLFVLSAPSGGGKTTLCSMLRQRFADLRYSVSYTTRSPRSGERDSVDYHFISRPDFEDKIKQGFWAEWAMVHGNFYGTSAEFIQSALARGEDILLDIDVQGALQILERFPDGISIFIMPPSLETLRSRLETRATDTPQVISTRMGNAEREMAQKHFYRHVVVNDDLNRALEELTAIIENYRGV